MANLFQQKSANVPTISPRQALINKYNTSRMNLLIAVAFTVLNLVLLVIGADSYLLFSIYLPYLLGSMGMLMCGKLPSEYYEDIGDIEFWSDSTFIILLVVAFAIIGVYLLAYFMSKKKSGWLIAALVFFSIDTLLILISGDLVNFILDIVFHAWVIYYLVVGIISARKLKKMPNEEIEAVVTEAETTAKDE